MSIKSSAALSIIDGVQLFPEIQTILMTDSSDAFKVEKDLQAEVIGPYKVAPWGPDNLLPNHVLDRVEKGDIVGANLRFNRDVAFGLGPKLVKAVAPRIMGLYSLHPTLFLYR